MAPSNSASNWLSFSLSSMDFLAPPQPHPAAAAPQFFLDNFYSNEWGSAKEHGMYDTAEDCGAHHQNHQLMAANYIETPVSGVPKLEDFLGGDTASLVRYSGADTSQTETQDSSLTHIYEPHHLFHHHHHHHHQQQEDLKAVTVAAATPGGFAAAFSGANSGSDVEDSANQVEFVGQNEVAYGGGVAGGLSLAVAQTAEKGVGAAIVMADSDSVKKIADTFGQRTSIYRGVTRHRWTGRYEAHLWDNSCRREGQARKGRQVYLGGYDKEEKAARSYDLAALKYWGPTATTNFPVSNYTKELEEMKRVTKQEFIASLRRKSSGFSRGASIYRGVTRHHQQGRWQARIGRVAGNKDLYLGTFATEEEAAEAYDIAAIKFRGVNAVTNFEMSRYDVDAILKSNLPIGGAAKRLKLSPESSEQKPAPPLTLTHHHQQTPAPQLDQCGNATSTINFAAIQPAQQPSFDSTASLYHQIVFHHLGATTMGQPMGSDSLSSATSMVGPMTLMTPQPPPPQAEFYIWPHQSY